mgnify:CR=1 FL=1
MNTFAASPGRQFVRSPGFQRQAGATGPAEFEIETIQSRRLTLEETLGVVYPASVTPFSIIPPTPNLGLPLLFQMPWREFFSYKSNSPSIPLDQGTSPPSSNRGLTTTYFGGDCFYQDVYIDLPAPVSFDFRLGLGMTSYLAHRTQEFFPGTSIVQRDEEWTARRSRFRTNKSFAAWLGRCEMWDERVDFYNFGYHVRNVIVLERFTTQPMQFMDVPFPRDDDPDIGLNVANFVLVGESPEAWSTRTGIPITA